MNLKARIYVQEDREIVQSKLAARLALLKEKGTAPDAVRKDTLVRKLRADLRSCARRLAGVAAQEKLNAAKVQRKAEKAEAAKQAAEPPPPKAEAKPAKAQKKEKKPKEKKPAPAAQ